MKTVFSKLLCHLSNILSKTSENVSTSLELQLDTSRKVYDLTKNISTMAASAQEASKLSEQVIQILKLVSTFQSTTLKLEEVCHDLRSLTKNSQGKTIHISCLENVRLTSESLQIREKIGFLTGYLLLPILKSTMTFGPVGSRVRGNGFYIMQSSKLGSIVMPSLTYY